MKYTVRILWCHQNTQNMPNTTKNIWLLLLCVVYPINIHHTFGVFYFKWSPSSLCYCKTRKKYSAILLIIQLMYAVCEEVRKRDLEGWRTHIFLSFFSFLPGCAMAKLSTLLNLMIFLSFLQTPVHRHTLDYFAAHWQHTGQSVIGLYLCFLNLHGDYIVMCRVCRGIVKPYVCHNVCFGNICSNERLFAL